MESTERRTTNQALEGFSVRPVLLIAAGLFVLELALAGRYGFHGDELYFLDSARHLQGGYVDQPILIPCWPARRCRCSESGFLGCVSGRRWRWRPR